VFDLGNRFGATGIWTDEAETALDMSALRRDDPAELH
jgi:hypothetical protein